MTIKIAARNVFRNRRRTLISLLVIGIGLTILSFVLGFVGEAITAAQRSLAMELGALQIGDPRVLDGKASGLEGLIDPEVAQRALALVEELPNVAGVTTQVRFAGLVGDEQGSTLLLARGIVPEDCMANYACLIVAGRGLEGSEAREIVLGERLAERLGVGPGDRVNVATGTVSGTLNAATVTVVGVVQYGEAQVEERLGFVPLGFAQRLLRTSGVERILVWLDDLDQASGFAGQLTRAFSSAGLPLAVRTWDELTPFFASLETFWSAFSGFTTLAVFALVLFSVLEVLTISFLERTREVGTVRALGASRGRVFAGFVSEGVLVGIVGGLGGAVSGAIVAVLFNALGLTFVPPGGNMPQPIRVAVSASTLVIPFLVALGATFLSSLYPAAKNARLTVVEALRSL
ncbi:ABC transporter permease [Candidatus Bipolaricaulota bacterium]|nr:ABC transporter permease [Candidatus Bipolaricaulota bacterium]